MNRPTLLNRTLLRTVIPILLAVAAIWPLSAVTVSAHSPVERRIPAALSVLDKPPERVELLFADPVQIHRSSIIVRNEAGVQVQTGRPQLDPDDDRHLFVDLQNELSSGTYTVAVHVVSIDGHALKETYTFDLKMTLPREPEPDPPAGRQPAGTPEEQFAALALQRAFPPDGSIQPEAPGRLELWYSGTADLSVFALLNDRQQLMPTGTPQEDPAQPGYFVVPLEEALPPGTYAVRAYPRIGEQSRIDTVYFAVEAFTPITGENTFPTPSYLARLDLLQLAHGLAYAALLILAGGVWFVSIIGRDAAGHRRWRVAAAVLYAVGFAAVAAELALNRADSSDVVLADWLRFNDVRIMLVQLILLGLSLIRVLRLPLLAAVVLLWAFAGHSVAPAASGGVWLTVILDAVHAGSAAIWAGGLAALLLADPAGQPPERQDRDDWLRMNVRTWGIWAFWSFAAAGLSGVLLALRLVPAFNGESMIESSWGATLAVKIALYLLILLIAVSQRSRLLRLTVQAAALLRKSARAELAAALLLLLAAGALVDFAPQEAIRAVSPDARTAGGIAASVAASPLKPGANVVTITLAGQSGDVEEVRARIYTGLGDDSVNTAFKLDEGVYKLTGNLFHGAGVYDMELQVRTASGRRIVFAPFRFEIPGVMPTNIRIEREE